MGTVQGSCKRIAIRYSCLADHRVIHYILTSFYVVVHAILCEAHNNIPLVVEHAGKGHFVPAADFGLLHFHDDDIWSSS